MVVPGTRFGSYEVLAPLGAGGMGEVYRGKDTNLGREVAIKVLPAAFSSDSERIARFRREAQVLASLFRVPPQNSVSTSTTMDMVLNWAETLKTRD